MDRNWQVVRTGTSVVWDCHSGHGLQCLHLQSQVQWTLDPDEKSTGSLRKAGSSLSVAAASRPAGLESSNDVAEGTSGA